MRRWPDMERLVLEDSPLADYLEGHGEAEIDSSSEPQAAAQTTPPTSQTTPIFAPKGLPRIRARLRRRKCDPEGEEEEAGDNTVLREIHHRLSKALNSGLGRADNARFLEQFRFILISSQLLSDHAPNASAYHLRKLRSQVTQSNTAAESAKEDTYTVLGLWVTVGTAFTVAWSIAYVRHWMQRLSVVWATVLFIAFVIFGLSLGYNLIRRQWLRYLRRHAVRSATDLVAKAQELNDGIAAALSTIQEVEVVSRGYRLSFPLPPISRVEERGNQVKRCTRLRRVVKRGLRSVLDAHALAYVQLAPLANILDLERYHDMYEVNRTDVDYANTISSRELSDDEDEGLNALRAISADLVLVRKLCLCCLLALEADGGKPDFSRWASAIEVMQTLSVQTSSASSSIDGILGEDETFAAPASPSVKSPVLKPSLSPPRERTRAQLRKLSSLSSGIRSLGAKMHILREDSDITLSAAVENDSSELDTTAILEQYEAIGADLRALLQEWEEGRVVLIESNKRRSISSPLSPGLSRSTTPSAYSGVTAVSRGNSPAEALKALNGEPFSATEDDESADEKVFEAIALPRARERSTLTREERIAKMREERERMAVLREEREQGTKMVKELENVIRMRPRGKTTAASRVRGT